MDTQQFNHGKRTNARQKLAADLAGLASDRAFMSIEENEMLSLMVDEALKGVDIKTLYPDFYRKLFSNAVLRHTFLDTLELFEAEKEGKLAPAPAGEKPKLAFLTKKSTNSDIQKLQNERWQVKLQKNSQQLKDIFSPPQLAYKHDANLFDDNWFTVLRDEIELDGSSYSILLECVISKQTEDALSAFLNIAMTLETAKPASESSIHATLQWGKYSETLTLVKEERARFPDIPFSATFNQQTQEITAGLELVLEIQPA